MVEQPAWLAVTIVALVAVPVFLRRSAPAAGPREAGSERPPRRLLADLALPGAAAVLVAMLVRHATPAAAAVMGIVALGAAWRAAGVLYAGQTASLSSDARRACIVLRAIAIVGLLVIVARPTWRQNIVEWEKPLLVVLLDESRSMSIIDDGSEVSRAERVQQALTRVARRQVERLAEYYDVRLLSIGAEPRPLDRWTVDPAAPASAISASLRAAQTARSVRGGVPAMVLLVSDGAETAAEPSAVLRAADDLAGQKTGVIAVGVGPSAAQAPGVAFDSLDVPGRIGPRDRLSVPVVARIDGCAGQSVRVELAWDGEAVAHADVRVPDGEFRMRREFVIDPPSPGVHRLTARILLPEERGGGRYATSAVIDVRDDRIRTVLIDARARSEIAFAARALRSDPRFDVVTLLIPREAGGESPPPTDWSAYDVVVVGDAAVPADAALALAHRVRDRGVGVLLSGGSTLFPGTSRARTELAEISPVARAGRVPPGSERAPLRLTNAGRRHPLFRIESDGQGGSPWDDLPELGVAVRFERLKPLAETLAEDAAGRPVLVAHDVGRGRVLAAAWESTWPWAMHSDAGLALHRRLWRQMIAWLANRRPCAWVLTDQPEYPLAALTGGQRAVVVRAGVRGGWDVAAGAPDYRVALRLRRVDPPGGSQPVDTQPAPPVEIPLTREGDDWIARWPAPAGGPEAMLLAGDYQLEFTAAETHATKSGDAGAEWRSSTRFTVRDVDRELEEPTHNLALLRQAAERTAAVGGRYVDLEEFSAALEGLLADDPRRQVERAVRYDPIERHAWLLFMLPAAALLLEWCIRRRAGLP